MIDDGARTNIAGEGDAAVLTASIMPGEAHEAAFTSRIFESQEYEAPFLIEKLIKECIAETPEEAEALFTEVKRYMIIAASDRTKGWHMYSLLIDECWHQFILFTQQYIDFCRRYFGRYVPHSPSNAPAPEAGLPVDMATFPEFTARYQELFGTPLPDLWHDARNVTVKRRVMNDNVGRLSLREDEDMVDLVHATGGLVMSINDLARDALAFITQTRAFYVRELPGDLDDEEKVALISTLVQCKILRVA